MSIDQTTHSFSFTPAKTEIKTVANGARGLLLIGLLGGPITMVIGSNVIQDGDIPGGIILLAVAEGALALGLVMIIAVFGLHLHLNLLRAMEAVRADLRAEIQQVRAEEQQLAGLLSGVAEAAGDQLGHRRDGD